MAQYKMQAKASDTGLMYYWSSAVRDFAGAGYPGTGTPTEVAVTGGEDSGGGAIPTTKWEAAAIDEDCSSNTELTLRVDGHPAGMYSIGGFINVKTAADTGTAQLYAVSVIGGSPTPFALGPPMGLTNVGSFAMPPVNIRSDGGGPLILFALYSGVTGSPVLDVWGLAS